MPASTVSCTFSTEPYDYSSGITSRLGTICASFEVMHGERRCIFRNGMSGAMAQAICSAICPMLRSDSGVCYCSGSDYYVVINRALYRLSERAGVWRLVQLTSAYGFKQTPLETLPRSVLFNIYLDASDVPIESRNIARGSELVSTLPQYRRARKIVSQCYEHIMHGTPLPDGLERVTDPQYLCSLNYQMLWDVINACEFDKNPAVAAEQQTKLMSLAVQRDRKDIWPESIHDFFKKAGQMRVFDKATKHIVQECRDRLSGLFSAWRKTLDPKHVVIGVSRNLDRTNRTVQKYLLAVNDAVLRDLAYQGDAVESAWY